jgi:hypothetical protein
MNEEMELTGQTEGTALEGDVGDISADEVTVTSGTAQTVEAQTVTVKQSAVVALAEISADSVDARQSGIGKVEAVSVRAEEGGVGWVKAEAVSVSDGGVFGAYADTAHLERSVGHTPSSPPENRSRPIQSRGAISGSKGPAVTASTGRSVALAGFAIRRRSKEAPNSRTCRWLCDVK